MTSIRVSRLRRAFLTVLSDIPASAAAFTMSSLASSFPSASKSSISFSACSVLVVVFPPAPDSSSSAVMSYSPIHEKPVSGSRQKATGLLRNSLYFYVSSSFNWISNVDLWFFIRSSCCKSKFYICSYSPLTFII